MKTQLKEHIFLIGFMGVGKTATSHVLSKLSGTKEFDTDQMIVKQEHKSIPDIFAEEGEEYFRQRETEILTRLRDLEPGIISCGGGMVMREVNVDKMKEQGKIVLLTATPEFFDLSYSECRFMPSIWKSPECINISKIIYR